MSNLSFLRSRATNWPESSMLVPRSQQKSVTEVRLLEAAVQLFARHGFSGTSTREIAQLADVVLRNQKGTLLGGPRVALVTYQAQPRAAERA
jgi:hypothetical protein